MPDQEPLRMCLLLGNEAVPEWFAQSLETALETSNVELSLVVQTRAPSSNSIGLLSDILQKKSWTIVAALQKVSETLFGPPEYAKARKITDIKGLEDVPRHRTTVMSPDEYGFKFDDETIDAVTNAADVVLHFGIGILRGDILNSPKYGVIGFHHGDLRAYRGGPPGLWEFIHGRSETGVTVQQFTETLDGGVVLAFESVNICDAGRWREVRRRQCEASKSLLSTALENLRDPDFQAESPELGPIYSTDERDWQVTLKYLFRETIGRVRLHFILLIDTIRMRRFN